MEPFFQFLGGFWWLAFPLFGALAAAGRAWERSAKRRHVRKLEIIRARGAIGAAQTTARIERPGAGRDVTPARQSALADHRHELERLFATHDAVTARWLDYELDVAKMIAFPAISDGRQPLTAAFLRARRNAEGLRPSSAGAAITDAQLAEYRSAVVDFETAFDVAEREARRQRDSGFTETERKRLDTAKQLLTVAVDTAATGAERQLAYRRVREELDGLISLSAGAIEILETRVAGELPPGAESEQEPEPDAQR